MLNIRKHLFTVLLIVLPLVSCKKESSNSQSGAANQSNQSNQSSTNLSLQLVDPSSISPVFTLNSFPVGPNTYPQVQTNDSNFDYLEFNSCLVSSPTQCNTGTLVANPEEIVILSPGAQNFSVRGCVYEDRSSSHQAGCGAWSSSVKWNQPAPSDTDLQNVLETDLLVKEQIFDLGQDFYGKLEDLQQSLQQCGSSPTESQKTLLEFLPLGPAAITTLFYGDSSQLSDLLQAAQSEGLGLVDTTGGAQVYFRTFKGTTKVLFYGWEMGPNGAYFDANTTTSQNIYHHGGNAIFTNFYVEADPSDSTKLLDIIRFGEDTRPLSYFNTDENFKSSEAAFHSRKLFAKFPPSGADLARYKGPVTPQELAKIRQAVSGSPSTKYNQEFLTALKAPNPTYKSLYEAANGDAAFTLSKNVNPVIASEDWHFDLSAGEPLKWQVMNEIIGNKFRVNDSFRQALFATGTASIEEDLPKGMQSTNQKNDWASRYTGGQNYLGEILEQQRSSIAKEYPQEAAYYQKQYLSQSSAQKATEFSVSIRDSASSSSSSSSKSGDVSKSGGGSGLKYAAIAGAGVLVVGGIAGIGALVYENSSLSLAAAPSSCASQINTNFQQYFTGLVTELYSLLLLKTDTQTSIAEQIDYDE